MEEQEQIVNQLAALAMEGQLAQPIDWKAVGISRDEAYKTMAANVIDQMQTVPEENFAAVAMATITKLLVENYVANVRLRGSQDAE